MVIPGTRSYFDPLKKNMPFHLPTISRAEYEATKDAWGLYTSIDVFGCDKGILSERAAIYDYTVKICDLLGVKRFGEPQLILFGGDPPDPKIYGWSMAQMIETSHISGHFIQAPRHAYVDLFSCKYYDPDAAIRFTVEFFQGKSFKYQCTIRGEDNALSVDTLSTP